MRVPSEEGAGADMTENERHEAVRCETASVSRRTLVKGAAWSVPVVAAMAVVPMAAASGANQIEWLQQYLNASSSKGKIKVHVQAIGVSGVKNLSSSTVIVTIMVTNENDPADTQTHVFSDLPLTVPAGIHKSSNSQDLIVDGLKSKATYMVVQTATVTGANPLPPVEGQITVS